ncbi:MAG: PUR family DNA/RNA-binding protein, partial [Candidatus Shikimatogenerans sp. JK-2022]|nr:PUR family DNA/RNA-binding protein [Candidatus Shikimatogenerans bostrichidophilus]
MNYEEKDKKNFYINRKKKEIFSKTLISRSRRYFFDTNETNAGDYFISITESKKLFLNDGRSIFKKHKIFLYKEDFKDFKNILSEMIKFIYNKKGKEIIINKNLENKNINFTENLIKKENIENNNNDNVNNIEIIKDDKKKIDKKKIDKKKIDKKKIDKKKIYKKK